MRLAPRILAGGCALLLLAACANREAGLDETGPVSDVTAATGAASSQITSILSGPTPSDSAAASAPSTPNAGTISLPPRSTQDRLTVWVLPDLPSDVVDLVNKDFAKTYPKVDVNVVRQDWATLSSQAQEKLPLQAETPDVIELAADEVAPYVGEGLLADLSSVRTELRAGEWTKGLTPATEVSGALSAAPLYGFGRVIAYDEAAWKAAGADSSPRTLEEFSTALERVQSGGVQPDYSAFWFPGRYWVGSLPWIWSQQGELAVEQDGSWVGAVDSSEAQAGLTQLQTLVQKFSRAPADSDETSASQVRAFDEGRASSALMAPWEVEALTKEAGVFPLPGVEPGTLAPQYLEGSDLAVSATSPRAGLAVAWIQHVLEPKAQKALVNATGWIPGMAAAVAGLRGTPMGDAQAALADHGKFTPATPNWMEVETQEVLPDMLQTILAPVVSAPPATSVAPLPSPTEAGSSAPTSSDLVPEGVPTVSESVDPSALPSIPSG